MYLLPSSASVLLGTIAGGVSPSRQRHHEKTEPSRRRTRASHSSEGFESLPLYKGVVWRYAILIYCNLEIEAGHEIQAGSEI